MIAAPTALARLVATPSAHLSPSARPGSADRDSALDGMMAARVESLQMAAGDPDPNYPPITMLRPPTGAPNILIVLLDDFGSAHPRRLEVPVTRPPQNGWPPAALS